MKILMSRVAPVRRKNRNRKRSRRICLIVLSFVLLSVLYVLPEAVRGGLIVGDDTLFHLNRLEEP